MISNALTDQHTLIDKLSCCVLSDFFFLRRDGAFFFSFLPLVWMTSQIEILRTPSEADLNNPLVRLTFRYTQYSRHTFFSFFA